MITQLRYTLTDPSASVTTVLDDTKAVLDHYIYSPTGEIHSVNAAWNTLDATDDSSGFKGIVGQLYKGRMSFGNHMQTDGRALYSALTGNLVTPGPDAGFFSQVARMYAEDPGQTISYVVVGSVVAAVGLALALPTGGASIGLGMTLVSAFLVGAGVSFAMTGAATHDMGASLKDAAVGGVISAATAGVFYGIGAGISALSARAAAARGTGALLEGEIAPMAADVEAMAARGGFPAAGRSMTGRVASNDILAESTIGERLAAYKNWKAGAGIEGAPTLARFRDFVRGNTGLNGGGFYAYSNGGFARLARIEQLLGEPQMHHGLPQAFGRDFVLIGIDSIDDYVYPVNGYQHLYGIHGGVGGGPYNTFWRQFFRGQHGPMTPENALQWLDFHRANGFIIP